MEYPAPWTSRIMKFPLEFVKEKCAKARTFEKISAYFVLYNSISSGVCDECVGEVRVHVPSVVYVFVKNTSKVRVQEYLIPTLGTFGNFRDVQLKFGPKLGFQLITLVWKHVDRKFDNGGSNSNCSCT